MTKILRFFISILIGIVVIIILALVAITMLVDPNDFKPQITNTIKNYTGYEVTIAALHWSFFPTLGINANKITIKDNSQNQLTTIATTKIQVQLVPLLHKHIKINELTLSDINAYIRTNSTVPIKPKPIQKSAPKQPQPSSQLAISVPKIIINNANLIWLQDNKETAKLNISKFSGTLAVDLSQKTASFSLNLDQLTFKSQDAQKPTKKTTQNHQTTKTILPTNKWKINGNVNIKKLVFNKLDLTNLKIPVTYKDQILQLNPITADLYQGNLNINTTANLQTDPANYVIAATITKLQLQKMVYAISNKDNISGMVDLTAKLTSEGDTKTLNGTGNFAIKDGVLKGVDIPFVLKKMHTLIKKSAEEIPADTKQTNFGDLGGTFNIKNGIFSNNDLIMLSKDFQVSGTGTINLINNSINYQLKAAKIKATDSAFTPIKITGTLTNPKFAPDFQYVIHTFVSKTIESTLTDIIEGKSSRKDLGKKLLSNLKEAIGIR